MPDAVEELREAVHGYFREVGYNGCELVFRALMNHGGLAPLLEKLGLPDPGNSEDQYAYLLNFLRRHGVDAFARRLESGGPPENRPRTPAPEDRDSPGLKKAATRLPDLRRSAGSNGPDANPGYQRVKASMPRKSGTVRLPGNGSQSQPAASPNPQPHRMTPPPPMQAPAKSGMQEAPAPAPAKAREIKSYPPGEEPGTRADGTWDGKTERRSGRDRRTRTDRRNTVDVVFKNKRYGGDRRGGGERRKNWPPKQWPPERDADGNIVNE